MVIRLSDCLEFRRRCKQETKSRLAISLGNSQSPVLILGREALRSGASFADHVQIFAAANVIHLHPGFERNRVASCEVKRTLRAAVSNRQVSAFAVQFDGCIPRNRNPDTPAVAAPAHRDARLHWPPVESFLQHQSSSESLPADRQPMRCSEVIGKA
jgi:hypothetical protein